jgi:HTH-type transcriptional regulator / antitoxin HigA
MTRLTLQPLSNSKEREITMIISTSAQYEKALKEIESFMNAFSDGENAANDLKIAELAKAIEEYEDHHVIMPMPLVIQKPETLPEVIELKMFEQKMKRKDMAKLLGITDTRLSEVMHGKRKINMDLAKRLYTTLGVDPKFILEKS